MFSNKHTVFLGRQKSMIIHNATFMIPLDREAELVDWLRLRLSVVDSLQNPRVSAMREAAGVDYRQAEAQSVAFQTEFPTIEEARAWNKSVFVEIAEDFQKAFAPHAMVFHSIFEQL